MTSRERVLTALSHRESAGIPIDFWAVPEVYAQLQQDLHLPDKEAVLRHFDVDLRYFNGPTLIASQQAAPPEGVLRDHWGVVRQARTVHGTRRDGTAYSWTYKHLLQSPLAQVSSVAELERYPWPTADLWIILMSRAPAGRCARPGTR